MAAKHSPTEYSPHGVAVDFTPFAEADFDKISDAARPVQVDRATFHGLIAEMNVAARNWKLLCDIDLAPTDRQEHKYVKSVHGSASKLAKLLSVSFEEIPSDPTSSLLKPLEQEEVPFDEQRVIAGKESDTMPDDVPEDPTAAGAWSIPLALERILQRFDHHYRRAAGEHCAFTVPEEALNELSMMVNALSSVASDRLTELEERRRTSERGTQRLGNDHCADEPMTFEDARSPNHGLFLDLVDIYEKMFNTRLRRSRTSPKSSRSVETGNRPSGPALEFYRFVFDCLEVRDGRSDETIIGWIEDFNSSRRAEP